MLNKKITDLPTLNTLNSTDKLLVSTISDTYNVTVDTLKSTVQDGAIQENLGVANAGKVLIVGNDGNVGLKDAGEIGITVRPLNVSENGTYTAPAQTAYNPVLVDVENTTVIPLNVSENGTYAAPAQTAYNPVVVNVEGGQSEPVQENDVNFYDYDGTLVNSYTAAEFANLSNMPSNPTHASLTSQGWNWSLEDAQTYVAEYGKLNIGQMYITDDGKTRIYVEIGSVYRSPMIGIVPRGEVSIDWGDGTTEIIRGQYYSLVYTDKHTYSNQGNYVIKLTVISGNAVLYNIDSDFGYNPLFCDSDDFEDSKNYIYQKSVKKIELGNNVTCGGGSFAALFDLRSLTLPNSLTTFDLAAFSDCNSLKCIVVPNGISQLKDCFYPARNINTVILPNTITKLDRKSFKGCTNLKNITIPDSVTSIGEEAFRECYGLEKITIPKSVATIGNNVFYDCNLFSEIHFTSITPPTCTSQTFSGLPKGCVIYVPTGTLSAYTSAANYPDPNTYTYIEE